MRQEKPISSGFYEFIRGDESWVTWVTIDSYGTPWFTRQSDKFMFRVDSDFLSRYEWIGPIETPEGVPEGISSW